MDMNNKLMKIIKYRASHRELDDLLVVVRLEEVVNEVCVQDRLDCPR